MANSTEHEGTVKTLLEQRASIWEGCKEILDRAEKENRALTAEEKEDWERRTGEIDALKQRIDVLHDAEQRDREMAAAAVREHGAQVPGSQEEREARYAAAFDSYMRLGVQGMEVEQRQILQQGWQQAPERRDNVVGTDSAGGYLVPQDFAKRIIAAEKAWGGMLQAAFVFSTDNGEKLPIPTDNDTTNKGHLLAEAAQAATTDITVGQASLGAYMFTSDIIRVSLQLMQDSAFDMNSYVAKKMGIRLGRGTNTYFTTGTGTSQPQGVVTGATLGVTGATGQTTSVTYDDLVNLLHKVDPAYRYSQPGGNSGIDEMGPNALWMFNDSTLGALQQLVDGNSRPLWQPGLNAGFGQPFPDTILGFRYVINQDMATMAASAKSILFGDFSNYWIRRVSSTTILRLTERYADYLEVGFIGFERMDGVLVDAGTHPIQYYANSAT